VNVRPRPGLLLAFLVVVFGSVFVSARGEEMTEEQFRRKIADLVEEEKPLRAAAEKARQAYREAKKSAAKAEESLAATVAELQAIERELDLETMRLEQGESRARIERAIRAEEKRIAELRKEYAEAAPAKKEEIKLALEAHLKCVTSFRERLKATVDPAVIAAQSKKRDEAAKKLSLAAQALDAAEQASRAAEASLDEALAKLDAAVARREAFEGRAAELLASTEPPFVRTIVVVDKNEKTLYKIDWVSPEEKSDELDAQIKFCRELIKEEGERILVRRRQKNQFERDFKHCSDKWQRLNGTYTDWMWYEAWTTIGLEIADSGTDIAMSSSPPEAAAKAVLEAGFRIYDAVWGWEKPAFADFPRLPSQWVAMRQKLAASDPVIEAAQAYRLPVPKELRTGRYARTGAGGPMPKGFSLTESAIRNMLDQYWGTPGMRTMGKDLGGLLFADVYQTFGKKCPTLVEQFSVKGIKEIKRIFVTNRYQTVAQARKALSRPGLTKDLAKSLAISAGKAVAKEAVISRMDEKRAAVFAAMFWTEIDWFLLRREYCTAAAALRFEIEREKLLRKALKQLLEEKRKEIYVRAQELVHDEVFTPGTYSITVSFGHPVKDVSVTIANAEGLRPRGATDDGLHYSFDLELPRGIDYASRAPIEISAAGRLTGKKLDAEPGTLAYFDGVNRKWIEYEPGSDRNGRLRTRPGGEGVSLVLLIDGSGSMREHGRLAASKSAAKRVLTGPLLKEGDEVAVWTFAGGVPGLCLAFTSDRAAAARAVDALQAHGETPLAGTILRAGMYLLNQGAYKRKILVILSDGNDTEGGSPSMVIRSLRRLSLEVR